MTPAEHIVTDERLAAMLTTLVSERGGPLRPPFSSEDAISLLTELQHRRAEEAGTRNWRADLDAVPRDRKFLIKYADGAVTLGGYLDNSHTKWPWQGIRPYETGRAERVGDKIVAWMELPSAASPSSPASGVRVRALEWRKPTDHPKDPDADDNIACADGLGGVYAVSVKQKAGPAHLLWWAHDPMDWAGFATVEEAKASAQADYETRILSALGEQP